MATLSSIGIGKRPVRFRIIAVHRISADAVRHMLPDGMRPRLFGGFALCTTCYTHLGPTPSRLFPHRRTPSHHLAFRIPACDESDASATWIARRITSHGSGARWGARMFRRANDVRFDVSHDAFGVALRVQSSAGEELSVRALAAARSDATLITTPAALVELLTTPGNLRPTNASSPEAERFDACNAFAPEPMVASEFRARLFEDATLLPKDCAELDGVWRMVTKRTHPVASNRTRRARTILRDDASAQPAL